MDRHTEQELPSEPFHRDPPAVVLTIAGSDSSAGAGLQVDLKTFEAHNVYGTCVITAITAQNTRGVDAIYPQPPEIISAQLNAVLSDFDVKAIKISMLGAETTIAPVIEALDKWGGDSIVFDPVLSSGTGDAFASDDLCRSMIEHILPRAMLITPNLPEAARLTNSPQAQTEQQMQQQARQLLQDGAKAVYLKGGHGEGDCFEKESVDLFADSNNMVFLRAPRHFAPHNHGSGCCFAASVTSHLATGKSLQQAVELAKTYIGEVLISSRHMQIGKGTGPVNPKK